MATFRDIEISARHPEYKNMDKKELATPAKHEFEVPEPGLAYPSLLKSLTPTELSGSCTSYQTP